MTENSKYIVITFLLYLGSGILFGVFTTSFSFSEGYIIGIISALVCWGIFFFAEIFPMKNGNNGLHFCLLALFSVVYLIPAMIISYILVSKNMTSTEIDNYNPNPLNSSSMDVWDDNSGSQEHSSSNSD